MSFKHSSLFPAFIVGKGANWGKASEKTWGDCPSIFLRLFRSLFSAPLPSSSRLSSLSECLEQAIYIRMRCVKLSRFIELKQCL